MHADLQSHPKTADNAAAQLAAAWFSRLTADARPTAQTEPLPPQPLTTLAAFVAIALNEGRTLLILVPDDTLLPDLSNALDIGLRPLCLVLPGAGFATQIALRATIALLKSRLSRDGEDSQSPPWSRQRARLAAESALWRETRDWAARNDRSACPLAIGELFPVRILPISAYRGLQHRATDITLLYQCEAPAELIAPAASLLRVGAPQRARQQLPEVDDAQLRLRQERDQLLQNIADLELELATVHAEVGEFTRQYYDRVGRRMAEFDALQAQLARAAARASNDPGMHDEAQRQQRQADQSAREWRRFEATDEETSASPFRPDDDLKRRFRRLAQQIHPDRASDDTERAWRTQLMSEANRAYRHGDRRALDEIASLWAESRRASAMPATDDDAASRRMSRATVSPAPTFLAAEVDRLRSRLGKIERELQGIFGSRLYELFVTARQAARQGRDLLAEMTAQLDASIAQLRARQPAAT